MILQRSPGWPSWPPWRSTCRSGGSGPTASRKTLTAWFLILILVLAWTWLTCAWIAQLVRDILRDIGHDPVPVTSGSKGIHLYAPLDGSQTSEQATEVARELALALEV